MTPQEIRALDGPSLCQLAYELRLSPSWAQWDDAWLDEGISRPARIRHGIIEACSSLWNPDENLAQANDCLEQMVVSHGWRMVLDMRPDAGVVTGFRRSASDIWTERVKEGWGVERPKARALLLACVLAMTIENKECSA